MAQKVGRWVDPKEKALSFLESLVGALVLLLALQSPTVLAFVWAYFRVLPREQPSQHPYSDCWT